MHCKCQHRQLVNIQNLQDPKPVCVYVASKILFTCACILIGITRYYVNRIRTALVLVYFQYVRWIWLNFHLFWTFVVCTRNQVLFWFFLLKNPDRRWCTDWLSSWNKCIEFKSKMRIVVCSPITFLSDFIWFECNAVCFLL